MHSITNQTYPKTFVSLFQNFNFHNQINIQPKCHIWNQHNHQHKSTIHTKTLNQFIPQARSHICHYLSLPLTFANTIQQLLKLPYISKLNDATYQMISITSHKLCHTSIIQQVTYMLKYTNNYTKTHLLTCKRLIILCTCHK